MIKTNFKDLNGDSGVGQAPEFPSKFLKSSSSTYASRLLSYLILIFIIIFLACFKPIQNKITKLIYDIPQPKITFNNMLNSVIKLDTVNINDPQFSLYIPKLDIASKIIANVDPTMENNYMQLLNTGVAQAKGSKVPGDGGAIYIFGHSTANPDFMQKYNAVFSRLNNLEKGDDIYVYYQGVKYKYTVFQKAIVPPQSVEYLTAATSQETLILQTCYPPGNRNQRLLVFAKK